MNSSLVLVEVPVVQPLSLPSPHNISPYNNKALETKLAQVRTLSYDFLNNNQNFSRTVVNLSKIMHNHIATCEGQYGQHWACCMGLKFSAY